MSYFADQLAIAIRMRGLTQAEVADLAKVTQSQLSRYLSSENEPSLSAVDAICRAFPEADRTAIARAWLSDQLPASARDLVDVRARRPGFALASDPLPLAPALRAAFDLLEDLARREPEAAAAIEFTAAILRGAGSN